MQVLRYEPWKPFGRLRPYVRRAATTSARTAPAWTPPVDIREEAERCQHI